MDTCITLTRRVEHLEHDKIAQALEITKLKHRVKKLERRNKASKLKILRRVGTAQRIKTFDDTVMDDVPKQERMIADMDADVDVILEDAKEVADVLSMQDDDVEPAELQEVMEVVTTAKLINEVVTASSATLTIATPQLTTDAAPTLTTAPSAARRRKRVVIRDLQETATPSTIIHSEAKSKDKGKWILVEEPKPLKKFKMDYFKGMTYDDIRPIFEKKFNSNVAFLLKTKEQMDEEDSRVLKRLSESQDDKTAKKQKLDEEVEELKRHLQIVPNDEDDVYTKATYLALKVPVVDYEIYTENNKPYYKIKRADGSHQLYLSFLTGYTSTNMEKLKKCLCSSEGQELEAVRVMWCADYHIHYNIVDFAEEESEVSLELLSFGIDVAKDFKENMLSDYCCQAKLMLFINAARPFLRTARALINVYGEELILYDEPDTLNSDLTSPKVKDDIFDPVGDIVLIEKLLNLNSTKDLHSSHNINPLSGSTTSSSPSLATSEISDYSLEEFADELTLIESFPLGNDDMTPEDVIREIEYLLNRDPLAEYSPNNDLIYTIPEMFTDEHTLDYSFPPRYDDLFDSKENKIKDSKLLIDKLDSPGSTSFLPYFLESDSVLYEDLYKVDTLTSTDNEDNVFNLGILVHMNLYEVTNRVARDKNVKTISSSNASLILKDYKPPLYDHELPFHIEIPGFGTLLSFSSKNEEKVFNLGILISKGVHSLLRELSHRDSKAFKVINIF
nr:hypothetical protein [Tanacetum cinerariifolium]